MFLIKHKGEYYDLPIEALPSSKYGNFPDKVMCRFDEKDFIRYFGDHATWTTGTGPYAVLAYCRELTITRHDSLLKAIDAKRPIDGGGCGGLCCRIHLIAYFDPKNGLAQEQEDKIADYIAEHNIKPKEGRVRP